ncbi:alpha/beta hydrolase family protein [Pedobacter kyonggii]|uniref:Serine aminopeptidase S33 domain-containing protein n=1 Tax=Pedobacter kyonggii TaxID=1926871 RepID=A0A4Q9HGC7_9SPHI|nr:hypothetical protein [Pedobacter kyonggii]TBO44302.1 hypothetical protein EYS08_03035 [Pedobacter kyonggii]
MKEEIIITDQFSTVGILTHQQLDIRVPTIILLNAGLVHRIGPNRIYVKLARRLSMEGYNVFRFDYGGQGDSLFYSKQPSDDILISKTLDHLAIKLKFEEFVLIGLCSGAEDAYHVSLTDTRIKGIVMINGTGLDHDDVITLYPEIEKSIQLRYYKKSLKNPDRWLKVLRGKSGLFKVNKLKRLVIRLFGLESKKVSQQNLELLNPFRNVIKKGVALLLVITEGSVAYDFLQRMKKQEVSENEQHEVLIMNDIDHIVTPVWAQHELNTNIIKWLNDKYK